MVLQRLCLISTLAACRAVICFSPEPRHRLLKLKATLCPLKAFASTAWLPSNISEHWATVTEQAHVTPSEIGSVGFLGQHDHG
eukprot:2842011-Amphidinium_carterae.1